MLQPSFLREQTNDTLAALRLAPIDPFSILAGKMAANFLFLLLVEVILLPVFAVLYNIAILPVLPQLLLVLALGTIGLATTGTVFSAVAAQARLRELLLPLLAASGARAGPDRQHGSDHRRSARPFGIVSRVVDISGML